MQKGVVVWFTGLPNAGKSTTSKLVKRELEKLGTDVELLDSDEVPRTLTKDLSPDWKTRQYQKCTNLTYIAKLLLKRNVVVLIASVGRFEDVRANSRAELKDFVEVYLKCPQDVRLERDDKAKYVRHADTIYYYEDPVSPEILIETNQYAPEAAAQKVVDYLKTHGYIGVEDKSYIETC